jgi:hypothetical protein
VLFNQLCVFGKWIYTIHQERQITRRLDEFNLHLQAVEDKQAKRDKAPTEERRLSGGIRKRLPAELKGRSRGHEFLDVELGHPLHKMHSH